MSDGFDARRGTGVLSAKAVFSSYPEIFFLHGLVPGLAVCAVMFLDPRLAVAGIVAVLSAYFLAWLVGMGRTFAGSGPHIYNPLLVGLSLGHLLPLSAANVLLIVLAGFAAFIATTLLVHAFQTHLGLPALSLPFVCVSTMTCLAVARYRLGDVLPPPEFMPAPTPASGLEDVLPRAVAGYLKSLGAVLFAPHVLVGIVISLAILYGSRILFLLSVLGYAVGVGVRAALVGSIDSTLADTSSFNFILIAMALGGVFLVPSLSSYLLAAIAVAAAVPLLDAVHALQTHADVNLYILPFNLVTLSVVYVLGVIRSPMLVWIGGRTPEETLENHLANRLRYRGQSHTLFLPFSGRWTVWQGFHGKWTHKGPSCYAYDFVITDPDGQTSSGPQLEDFYAWRKPVLSPVRGWIVKVVDHLPDNPPASVNETAHTGNLVILKDPRGFFVKLCHFAAGSIRVKDGEWVERGHVLGLCGNSGFSPQPHIHVQVQGSDSNIAESLPFSFVSYLDGQEFCANDTPAENRQIEPLYADKGVEAVTNFILDDALCFRVLRAGREIGRLNMFVRMAPDGTFYFESGINPSGAEQSASGQQAFGRLYFGRHEGTFYFYRVEGDNPWLRLIFLALPRLPMAQRDGLVWNDYVPVGLATAGIKRACVRFLSSFYPDLARIRVTQCSKSTGRIECRIESKLLRVQRLAEVELDAEKGFKSIRVDDIELVRGRISERDNP